MSGRIHTRRLSARRYEFSVEGEVDPTILGAPWIESTEGTEVVTHFLTANIEEPVLYELLDHMSAQHVALIRLHRLDPRSPLA
ncbi:hypothetical protein ACSMXN_15575 [Jatrophihabitans sp. DSM 45814]